MGIRKCSKCGKTGHNSRTCRNPLSNCGQVMKLFGVEFTRMPSSDDAFGLRKTLNFIPTEILSSDEDFDKLKHIGTTQGQIKKGIPWSEEEHRLFLVGLEKLGKGNWRGISRNFVTTRTSTQVASHAQKYFLRRNKASENEFGPTIFSMVRRNEAQCCIYSKERPNNIPPSMLPEVAYNNCRLFNNSSTQNSPSLELSLAAPPPAPLVWEWRPVVLWKKQYQYVVQNKQYQYHVVQNM